jgi:RNA polymerase sigma factor (TIGR02999 family)
MSQDATQFTRLLDAAGRGEAGATDRLLPLVYDELRRVAAGLMSREKPGLTLQPTALVHEAYMRLLGTENVSWQNRAHFFGAAATAMRRILIDRARHVKAARIKAVSAETDEYVAADDFGPAQDVDQLLALDEALMELAQRDARQHDVVMLRYFAGLTIEQTSEALSLSTGTVKNEWSYARAWLLHQIEKRTHPRQA